MFNEILVVCVGNICRSPTGEYLLKHLLPEKGVRSAGIGTLRSGLEGKPADPTASLVAKELGGLDLSSHRARQLTKDICRQSDLILVMEKGHTAAIAEIAHEVRGKIMLFGHWINQKEIPDPFRKSREVFDYTYRLIEQSARSWLDKLQ